MILVQRNPYLDFFLKNAIFDNEALNNIKDEIYNARYYEIIDSLSIIDKKMISTIIKFFYTKNCNSRHYF